MSIKQILTGVALLAASAGTAHAQAIDTEFFIGVLKDGVEEYAYTTEVPNIPGEICYYWRIQLEQKTGAIAFTERFTLPGKPTTMGDVEGEYDPALNIEGDGTIVTQTINGDLDGEGWFGNGWCISAGDPNGEHNITVTMRGKEVGSFDFTVVDGEGYQLPETGPLNGQEDTTVTEPEPEPEPETPTEDTAEPTEETPAPTDDVPIETGNGKDKEAQY